MPFDNAKCVWVKRFQHQILFFHWFLTNLKNTYDKIYLFNLKIKRFTHSHPMK